MAKIGIITFSHTLDNYGQVLQYLAIQEYLEARGHQVSLIRQVYSTNIFKKFARRFIHFVFNKGQKRSYTIFDRWSECTAKYEALHPRKFEDFRKKHCNIVTLVLPAYKRGFDAFAVGSDQIWSSTSSFCFLNFVRYGELKFALAPSIGKMKVDEHVVVTIKNWLQDFKFITCREQSAVDMCKRAGRADAQLVLDPTFLINKEAYLKYSAPCMDNEEYIFLYMLGADVAVNLNSIYEFAQREGLKVKYVASQGREDDFPKVWATIPEWITLLANAKYVFTNSFHGMALSCIFSKQFLVFPIVGEMEGMNERIFNIAQKFNCKDRIFTSGLEQVKQPVDYKFIQTIIEDNRNVINRLLESIQY